MKNEGIQNQLESFSISLQLTGPQTIIVSTSAAVMSGESVTVTFPPVIPDIAGEYMVSAFTQLAGDQNRQNDTVRSNFLSKQYNSGIGDGGYFYATSNMCGTSGSASPQFHWKDTSNSISLLENGTDVSQEDMLETQMTDTLHLVISPMRGRGLNSLRMFMIRFTFH